MKKIAVILSGCGYLDGSEIHESVLTLLALDRAGVSYECLAPNILQHRVMNHLTREEMPEKRNVLVEAARIARGAIKDVAQANPNDFDAVILPGGYGAALNLSDFGIKQEQCEVQQEVANFLKAMAHAKKPAGFICIAPALIPKIYQDNVQLTIGNDSATASALEKMGGNHEVCSVENIVIDNSHRVVTTPAYMLGPTIAHVAKGIDRLVQKIVEMA